MKWLLLAACLLVLALPAHAQQQVVDPDFKPVVAKPAYAGADAPTVAIDEAHGNFHTASGNYLPFAELLRADGYKITPSATKFGAASFRGVDVLVSANAGADGQPAFTDAEADAIAQWVEHGGGKLLLIADHAPFGAATEIVAKRFGVGMGKGWAYDSEKPGTMTTQLTYSRANGLLGKHPIMEGRDASEQVKLVKTFTGQSLGLPDGATALLTFNATAREAPDTDTLNAAGQAIAAGGAAPANTVSVAGRVQGLAMPFGKGRVVVLGEAGMFSAQMVKFPPDSGQADRRFGMHVPGTDDQQFALNVMHWLSGALD